MADAFADAAAWMVEQSTTWWIDTDESLNEPVVAAIQDVTQPLTVTVAAAGMILLGIRMVMRPGPEHLMTFGEGLAKLVFWTVAGVGCLQLVVEFSGAFAAWVLSDAANRDTGRQLLDAFAFTGGLSTAAVLLLSLIAFLASLVQWVISLMREGAVIILAGCMTLAAAGTFSLGRTWHRRVLTWALALVWWEPAAALVYFAAFRLIGEAQGGEDVLVGITMLCMAVLALPALIRLFSWAADEMDGRGGRAGWAAMAAASRVRSRSARRMGPDAQAELVGGALPPAGGGRGGPGAGPRPSSRPAMPSGGRAAGAGAPSAAAAGAAAAGGATSGAKDMAASALATAQQGAKRQGHSPAGLPGTASGAAAVPETAGGRAAASAAGQAAGAAAAPVGTAAAGAGGAASAAASVARAAAQGAANAATEQPDGARPEAAGDGQDVQDRKES
ncbi:hypothetical protein [Streptomyces sp. NPDC049879]|uniref:hypothetical protein n=1 Tax=Streptomyces sp. NPDC049879 TaxID=3365598 RepID=UPI0037B15808